MFSKIYVLSVFVFYLSNLGQAAPIIDEVSSLSTRELPSLDARGFLDFFHKKLDKDTQKHVDTVSVSAECQMHNVALGSQKAYQAAQQSLKVAMDHASKEKKPVQQEYKKRMKEVEKKIKDAKKKVEKREKNLKKLGISDAAHHCPSSHSSSSHSHSEES